MAQETLSGIALPDLTESQQAFLDTFGAAHRRIVSIATEPRIARWNQDARQAVLAPEVAEVVFNDLLENPVTEHCLTVPGGQLKDPFPRFASLNSAEQKLLERGWRTMTECSPDAVSLFSERYRASYYDEADNYRDDKITILGWVAAYDIDAEGIERDALGDDFWKIRMMRIGQTVAFWLADEDPIPHISRTVTLYSADNRLKLSPDVYFEHPTYQALFTNEAAPRKLLDTLVSHVTLAEQQQAA